MTIVIRERQPRYTPDQAEVAALNRGYDNADDYMTDLGYYRCGDCGDYIAEPGGYDNETASVLCDRCAT